MTNSSLYVTAQTTADTRELAESLAESAVAARLTACVQISPVRSYYWWDGEVQNDSEFLLTFKTTAEAAAGPLRDLVSQEHTYDEPEYIVQPITGGSDSYLAWIGDSVTV